MGGLPGRPQEARANAKSRSRMRPVSSINTRFLYPSDRPLKPAEMLGREGGFARGGFLYPAAEAPEPRAGGAGLAGSRRAQGADAETASLRPTGPTPGAGSTS